MITHTHLNTTLNNTTPLCYYRGYSFRTTDDGQVAIWRGGYLSCGATREKAEKIVDDWLDAR